MLKVLRQLRARHRSVMSATAVHRAVLLAALLSSSSAYGQALGGLQKTTTFFTNVESWIYVIIPIAAVIGGLIIVVLYMNNMMHKDNVGRWFLGLVVATTMAELVAIAFSR